MADFTVADVLTWARTKPVGETYCYDDNGYCAIAQFLLGTGRARRPNVGSITWNDLGGDDWGEFSRDLNAAVKARPRAFGALVKRLEVIVQETPIAPTPWTDPQTYLDADCEQVSA